MRLPTLGLSGHVKDLRALDFVSHDDGYDDLKLSDPHGCFRKWLYQKWMTSCSNSPLKKLLFGYVYLHDIIS